MRFSTHGRLRLGLLGHTSHTRQPVIPDNQHRVLSRNQSENGSCLSPVANGHLMSDLEAKLLGTLRDQAFQSLRACIEAELHSFKLSIESLSSRVSQLEESGITSRIRPTDHTLDQTSIDPSICPGAECKSCIPHIKTSTT